MQSKKPLSVAKPIFMILMTLLLASAVVPAQTQAAKFKVLHTFHGKDGSFPLAPWFATPLETSPTGDQRWRNWRMRRVRLWHCVQNEQGRERNLAVQLQGNKPD